MCRNLLNTTFWRNKTIIALYARQSVDRENSISIETQLEYCKTMVKPDEQSLSIKTYIDKGFGGGNTDRPAFKELVRDIENKLVSKVIVYKIDRISRSLSDFIKIQQLFDTYNVTFISSQEAFDTSSVYGDVILKILMVFAEFERTSIINRVRDSYEKRSEKGLYMGGRRPFGFKLTDTILNGLKTKQYIPIPNEIEQIHLIFNIYSLQNSSLRTVQEALEKAYGGQPWAISKINSILKNPIYVKADTDIYNYFLHKNVKLIDSIELFDGSHAAMLYGRTSHDKSLSDWSDMRLVLAQHFGIVSSTTWLKCQLKNVRNKCSGRSLSNNSSWLSGKIYCSRCGCKMTTIYSNRSDGTKQIYFICRNKIHNKNCLGTPTVYADDMEQIISICIENKLAEIMPFPSAINTNVLNEVSIAQTQLIEIRTQQQQLGEFALRSDLNYSAVEIINSQSEKLLQREKQLLSVLADLSSKKYRYTDSQSIVKLFKSTSVENKKSIADIILYKINILSNGDIQIIWSL